MVEKHLWLLAIAVVLSIADAADGADALPARVDAASPVVNADVREATELIDKHLAGGWAAAAVEPAPLADDAEFLRRVYLDLAGRIPSVAEARAFLDDSDAEKRQRLVERLLASPRYVANAVNVWRSLLLPETSVSQQARTLGPGFETWLRDQLGKNAGYDVMVRELLTAPIDPTRPRFAFNQGQSSNPLAYFVAKETKPENVAAAAARVFLGIRLECAQCHDHPFAAWKQDQFWSLAAFFSGMGNQNQGDFAIPTQEVVNRRELTIPGTQRVVQAKFPDGSEPAWDSAISSRRTLAEWITAPQNPYFARATVNRMWYQLFGHALVEPVDEMVGAESTVSHPALLDELAARFAAQRFDLKFLVRAITASRAYQLTSAGTDLKQANPRLFARMPLKGLTAEQLIDSLIQATGHQDGGTEGPRGGRGAASARDEIASKFAEQSDQPTEFQTTILQSLAMMNGRLIADQTALERSDILTAVLESPFLDADEQIETLYLATLSRKPKSKELARITHFIENSEGESRETARKNGLADVFWALLNSGEFLLNH